MIQTKILQTKFDVSGIQYTAYPKDMSVFTLYKYVADYTFDCCSVFSMSFPSYASVKTLVDFRIVSSDFVTHEDCFFFYNFAQCIKILHYSLRNDPEFRKITKTFEPSLKWLCNINEILRTSNQIFDSDFIPPSPYSKKYLAELFELHIKPFLSYKDPVLGSLIIYLTIVKKKFFIQNNHASAFLFLMVLLAANGIPPFSIPRESGGEYYSLLYDFLTTGIADPILSFFCKLIPEP